MECFCGIKWKCCARAFQIVFFSTLLPALLFIFYSPEQCLCYSIAKRLSSFFSSIAALKLSHKNSIANFFLIIAMLMCV